MEQIHPADLTPQIAAQELHLNDNDLARRLVFVGFTPEDARRMPGLKPLMELNVQGLADIFFEYLSKLTEAQKLLHNKELLAQARLLKVAHLRAMVAGDYGMDYAHQRLALALIYAKTELDPRVFLGAFHNLLKNLGLIIMKYHAKDPLEGFEIFMSLKKIAFFDLGLFMDLLILERERALKGLPK